MSSKSIIISESSDYHLRSIQEDDVELLRVWKNRNKQYFFHNETISIEQQLSWYRSFRNRADDHMFVVEELCRKVPHRVGAMGYRVKDHHADIYNIMRGATSLCAGYTIGQALRLMISYIKYTEKLPVRCLVLRNNPALDWYLANGMDVITEGHQSYELEYLDNNNPVNFSFKEL